MADLNQSSAPESIRELLQTFWRGKIIIAAITLVATSAALAHYYTAVPVYKAQAVIMVKSPDKEKLIKDSEGAGGLEFTLPTNVELLKSYPISQAAVQKLLSSEQRNSLELFGNRSRRSKAKAGPVAMTPPDANKVRTYVEALQQRILAENIRGTNLIQISVTSPYPEEAALLANSVCDAYRFKNAEWSAVQDLSISRTIEDQIDQQEKKVRETDNALSEFMKKNEIYEASGNVAELQRSYSAAVTEYDTNRAQFEILKKQLSFIEDKLTSDERIFSRNLYQNISNQLRSMRENIRAKENTYIELALKKGRNDPEVESARNQLVSQKAQYDQINRTKIAGELANSGNAQKYRYDMLASKMQLNIRLAELENAAREYQKLKDYYQGELNQIPAKQIIFAKLSLDNDVAKKTYAFLKQKLDEARIKAASNIGGVVIIKQAFAPGVPNSPDLAKDLLFGVGGGLALGIVAVFMKEKMAIGS